MPKLHFLVAHQQAAFFRIVTAKAVAGVDLHFHLRQLGMDALYQLLGGFLIHAVGNSHLAPA